MLLQSSPASAALSLNGTWAFKLDPDDTGESEHWFLNTLEQTIQIPGSWEEQGFGFPPKSRLLSGWTKLCEYEGAAWYSRTVEVPVEWSDQTITLVLKGVRWSSRVWVDGALVGEQQSLSVPHRFNLTAFVQPGTSQQLAIRVDNRMLLPLQESHINSNETATHWGGITSGIELFASPATAIQQIKCYPNVAAKRFDFEITVSQPGADLSLDVTLTNPETGESISRQANVSDDGAKLSIELGDSARLWWDDDPFLYSAAFTLRREQKILHTVEKQIGLREFTVRGRQFLLNGEPIFLRGYVDCCIFPNTGYPVWDIEHYHHQFRIAKSYGFNHVRLHSWTAPEPFFQAADELGMLVQTELPNWTHHYGFSETEPPEDVHRFLMDEMENIVTALHLHPSWVMLSNGNELIYRTDGHPRLLELSARGKELDPTRLYTDNTGFGQMPAPSRPVDYYIQSCNWHPPKKIYDAATNNTNEDFSAVTAYADRPVVGHEHGQFTMYVRPAEAEKYKGVIRPTWLESINATFEAKNMSARLDDYIQASGTHIVRTYKENIERARRTQGLAGLHLLDIRDFPGQGHATTGILDMFWDSKGLVEPEIFKQFNDAVVLLLRSPSPTFWNRSTLRVDIEVSNFGHTSLTDQVLHWELRSRTSEQRLTGEMTVPAAQMGEITRLGTLQINLPDDDGAHAWELHVSLGEARNSWHVWSFPYPTLPDNDREIRSRLISLRNTLPGALYDDDFSGTAMNMQGQNKLNLDCRLAISDRLSLRLLQYLHDGGSVWLMPGMNQLYDRVSTRYLPPFWSYLHFPDNVSSVMGMLIHPHPALGRFPHDGFSDWHWYSLVNDTPAICLDSVPFVEPIVEVVDNFNRTKRLCYAFEAHVGAGKLFVSTWRLYDAAVAGLPEGRFLLNEIVTYLRGGAFAPTAQLSVGQLLGLFRLTNGLMTDFE